jgi:hypothetical protein
MPNPTLRSTGVSSPGPVVASAGELMPVFPVDEGLLTTAKTGDVVVVVAPTLGDGTDVVDVVVEVVEVVEVDVVGDGEVVVVVVVVPAETVTTLKPSAPCPVT